MIRKIHQLLTSIPMTRQIQRAIVHKVEKEIGAIDAFLDLVQFIRSEKPAAVLDAGAALAKRSLEFLKSTKFAFTDLSPLHQFLKRFQHLSNFWAIPSPASAQIAATALSLFLLLAGPLWLHPFRTITQQAIASRLS